MLHKLWEEIKRYKLCFLFDNICEMRLTVKALLSPVLPSMRPPQNQLAAVSPSFTTNVFPKEYSDDFDNCDNCESCDNSDNLSQQRSADRIIP